MVETYLVFLILACVLGLFFIVSYLTKKNRIDTKVFEQINSSLEIADLVLKVVKVDDAVKNKALFVLDLADIVTEFAYDMAFSDEDKEQLALDLFHKTVEKADVSISDDEEKLVQIVISESLKWLENNIKNGENQ